MAMQQSNGSQGAGLAAKLGLTANEIDSMKSAFSKGKVSFRLLRADFLRYFACGFCGNARLIGMFPPV